jgi:thioredoxin reductase (NADPH)
VDDDTLRLVGSRWSPESGQLRDFLARNGVPHRWLDAERDGEATRLLAVAGLGPGDVPVVVVPGSAPLVRPDRRALAVAVGLPTSADGGRLYDLVIVGGGPAGLGAAVYGASEGLDTLLVEAEATGGQAGQSSRIENYLGFPNGLSGGELAQRALDQARRFETQFLIADDVCGLAPDGPRHVLRLAGGEHIAARAVVLACGVSYRRLPPVDRYAGRGVRYGAAVTEGPNCKDADVYIVGGANSAGQAAVYFSRFAGRVTLVVRGEDLRAGMSEYLVRRCEADANIEVRLCTEVAAAGGDDHLRTLTLRDTRAGREEVVDSEHLFVFIGAEPRTAWLGGDHTPVRRDRRGFVLTGPDLLEDGRRPAGWPLPRDPWYLETSVPGVFAAGDVRAGSVKRVASAVGEGAMAVTLVHRFLEDT